MKAEAGLPWGLIHLDGTGTRYVLHSSETLMRERRIREQYEP